MNTSSWIRFRLVGVLSVAPLILASSALTADHLSGRVLGAGGPIATSTVTLWEAGSNEPKKLAEAKTNDQGQFEIRSTAARGTDSFLYLVATGGVPKAQKSSADNPAIVLLTVLGNKPPDKVVINEFTTIASVWTNAQFLDGPKLQGNVLGLRIAAGNVPNFVDLQTGGWGGAIQDPLNGGQTPTMANFATLADVLAGCVTLIRSDACSSLFYAATSPRGEYPKDTLAAANIARYPWYQPEKLFGLLNYLYPAPQDHNLRLVPFMPYLNFTPSAWVLPLKFDGGGLRAGGKGMFDSDGNFMGGRQLHRGMAGTGLIVGGPREQIHAKWQAAVADHHRVYGWRNGGRLVRSGGGCQGQRLVLQLRQQVHSCIRQERQAALGSGRHHVQWAARSDAGHHRHSHWRCLGAVHLEEPACALSKG